jgi:HEAT repeats
MNARMRLFLLGFALVAAIAIGWFFNARTKVARPRAPAAVVRPAVPHEEPVYQGKPLRYWVTRLRKIEEYHGAPEDAVAAIRAIGAKAVPFLLDWMPRPETLHRDRPSGIPDWTDVEIAWWALGTNGQSTIPILARLIAQPRRGMDDHSVWTESAKAISYLGPDAMGPMLTAATNMQGRHEVWELLHNFGNLGTNGAPAIPALIHWANDPDYFVRDGVVSALGGIGQRPDLALPVILNALEHDPDGMVRRDAGEALGAFANQSDVVLPELIKMLKDPNWEARQGALSGLGKIRDKPDVVIPLIVPFLSDKNSVIERTAAYALRELDCRTAYEALASHRNPNIGDIVYEAGEQEKARRKYFK